MRLAHGGVVIGLAADFTLSSGGIGPAILRTQLCMGAFGCMFADLFVPKLFESGLFVPIK